jgi:hypothetical protein
MAANLQKAGHSLVVYNRTREKAEQLLAGGAAWAESLAALAIQVELIFTMLAHPEAVKDAALGQDGFLANLAPGGLWADCSTVNPSFSLDMAAEARYCGRCRACFENISGGLAAGRGGWLRCSTVADFSRICALVAPRHPPRRARNPSPNLFSKHALKQRLATHNAGEVPSTAKSRP